MAEKNIMEADERVALLNSILQCPHRDLDKIINIHLGVQAADPLFYARFAAWHREFGEIRDHNEVFAGLLCVDPFLDNRETGLALLRLLPTYLKERVCGLIKGKRIKIRHVIPGTKVRGRNKKMVDKVSIERKDVGLNKILPRSFKNEIRNYLRWLEADNGRFDEVVLSNFKAVQKLYKAVQTKPGNRAKDILFERKIPADSKLTVLREILDAKSPVKKAELIIKHKIPYTTAVGLISKITPTVLTALISQMTPQQVVNNIGSLEERGAYRNADLKKLVMEKLKKAGKAKNVSGLKAKVAKDATKVEDAEIRKQLDTVADESIRKKRTINMPTGIVVDTSASMGIAITVGKKVASMVSGATNDKVYVVTTDTMAREIKAKDETMTAWENAFKGIMAGGATSIGTGVEYFQRKGYRVEQIILITDEGENRATYIGDAIEAYRSAMNVDPKVVVLKLDSNFRNEPQWAIDFRNRLTKAVGDYATYEISNDDKGYYALPGLIPLLSQKSKLDLLYEIMDYRLPERRPFDEMFTKTRKRKKKVA